ncbi:MAG: DUF2935 domain-containing protein [Tissierellia bacterium]|nr:DUF2935 domain-containing protein [Tissierellia bacterium]MDD4726531.1 DUF2935 domain-containing protein [Tissierellia bacterium]
MNNSISFIRQSLELHLFFARIMKEHSFFLQLGFTPRDINFTQRANDFRMEFDKLLRDVVLLSDGVVSKDALKSGEIITPYTLEAEKASEFFTGINIPTKITKAEERLVGSSNDIISRSLVDSVSRINNRAIRLISGLIEFKATILDNVLECNMFTVNYPLLIDHIMREARLYLEMVRRLQRQGFINLRRDALEQEVFWNRIMAEHSKFIRGFLDPTEEELFHIANAFGHEFDQLTREAIEAMNSTIPFEEVTENSLRATKAIRNFKTQATEGLLNCNIRSIIIPLLGDHTLREANHFLRLLRMFNNY